MNATLEEIVAALDDRDHQRLIEFGDLPRYMAQFDAIMKDGSQSGEALHASGFPYLGVLESAQWTDADADRLKSALMNYAASQEGHFVPQALWALGYFFDPDLIGFLKAQLERHLSCGPSSRDALGQCIIALSTIGEDILSDGSFWAGDHQKNAEMARNYLDKNQ